MRSLEELALRCLLPGFVGSEAPEWVRRRAAQGLGGVVLYARNVDDPDQLARLTASLHHERPELVIAVDEEGGDVTRLEAKTGSSYPGNLALGVAGDLELTRDVAAAIGMRLSAAGIDLDLAPDADVNSNVLNPVIGVRSFGSDAHLVGAHVAAWIDGLQGVGVAACAKHFPGHGDTAMDSHLQLPTVSEDPHVRALAPFQAAIAAGVRAIMSAHILVPSLDDMPATISSPIMTGLLRDELGFQGLAISDGLEMRGLTADRSLADAAVLALAAGCDALCTGGGLASEDTVNDLVSAIVSAAKDGRLSPDRLDEAAGRVDRLVAARRSDRADLAPDGAGMAAARRALRVEGEVAVGDHAVVARVDARVSMAAGPVPWGLARELVDRGVTVDEIDIDGRPADVEEVLHRARGKSLLIVVRDLHARIDEAKTIEAVLARRPDAVVVEMGWPAERPAAARGYIVTHGAARVCAVAAAEALRP